jgi:Transposase domain (DUF772)
MVGLGFERAEAVPGDDPRDLLKLYLYGYLQQIRFSRRLEAECRRNMELMWLLGRLSPDYKTIAEFRRMHRASCSDCGPQQPVPSNFGCSAILACVAQLRRMRSASSLRVALSTEVEAEVRFGFRAGDLDG